MTCLTMLSIINKLEPFDEYRYYFEGSKVVHILAFNKVCQNLHDQLRANENKVIASWLGGPFSPNHPEFGLMCANVSSPACASCPLPCMCLATSVKSLKGPATLAGEKI